MVFVKMYTLQIVKKLGCSIPTILVHLLDKTALFTVDLLLSWGDDLRRDMKRERLNQSLNTNKFGTFIHTRVLFKLNRFERKKRFFP